MRYGKDAVAHSQNERLGALLPAKKFGDLTRKYVHFSTFWLTENNPFSSGSIKLCIAVVLKTTGGLNPQHGFESPTPFPAFAG